MFFDIILPASERDGTARCYVTSKLPIRAGTRAAAPVVCPFTSLISSPTLLVCCSLEIQRGGGVQEMVSRVLSGRPDVAPVAGT